MILYKEDWKKHPGAIVHWETKNTTWVDLVSVFEAEGVENRYFHLALHNPELKDLDPFSPDLTPEQMMAVAMECFHNPWYFFREIMRIRESGATEAVQFRAHRGNVTAIWCFLNHITFYLLMPRQFGKSQVAEGIDVYCGNIACRNAIIHIYCKDDKLRRNIIAREKALLDELPEYLKVRDKKDSNNTEDITWNAFNNKVITDVAQASVKLALNVGRGLPIVINRLEEFAYCVNNELTTAPLLTAGNAAKKQAKLTGSPYGTIITTTAGFLNSKEGIYAKKIYDECLPWTDLIFDCKNEEDTYEVIRKNNRRRLDAEGRTGRAKVQVLLEYNHRQLGCTDEELMHMIESAMSEGDNMYADFFNIWGHGNVDSPLSKEDLRRIMSSRPDVVHESIDKNGYISRIYVNKNMLERKLKEDYHIMGMDTSDAIGNDEIFKTLMDVRTAETIAAGNYNEVNTISLSNYIVEMLIRYPKLTLIIERKSSAMAMLDNIFNILIDKGIDPFKRIYSVIVDDMYVNNDYKSFLQTPVRSRDIAQFNKLRKYFGYNTSGKGMHSRDVIYNNVFNIAIRQAGHLMRDKVIVSQCASLIRRNGRIDHPVGEHDDGIFSWLLCYWFLMYARNKSFYGIPEILPLSGIIRDKDQTITTEEEMRERKVKQLKDSIDKIQEDIKECTSDIIQEQLYNKYLKLIEKLPDDNKEILTLDAIKRTNRLNKIGSEMLANRYINLK